MIHISDGGAMETWYGAGNLARLKPLFSPDRDVK